MKEILKTVWALFFIPRAIIIQYFVYICGLIKKECND